MQPCNLCPRKCGAMRALEGLGVCKAPDSLKLAKACLHFGEEPCISGTNGSGTVFFSGCNLKCVFCQNFNISHGLHGKEITVYRLAEIMRELESKGAHNINFVTPTHYFDKIKEALEIYRPSIPLVYNSSGYDDISVIEEDIFDIYLLDLKFFSREKSLKYANCENYFDVASAAVRRAYELKRRAKVDREGMMQSGLIVRHLLLPSSTNDAIKIIEWLDTNTPDIYFSLMSQYLPMHRASEFPEINRKVTKREYEKVVNACMNKNFKEIYIQSQTSATDELIPSFDLEGL